jgi:hypothetical protein
VTIASSRSIAGGDQGTLDTLALMRELVDKGTHTPLVVDAARSLATRAAAPRDEYGQAIAIREWLKRVWRFVDDPFNGELLRSPDVMLREYFASNAVMGDCDEAAILGATLGKSIGLGACFTVYAFDPRDGGNGGYSHVFATLLTSDGRSVNLDVTKPAGSVPAPSRELTVEV